MGDFKGTTGEDHFIFKDDIYEIIQDGDSIALEFEQENHSHFEEINPRVLTMQVVGTELHATIGMLVQSDIDTHRKQNWTGCNSATLQIHDRTRESTLFFHQWTL